MEDTIVIQAGWFGIVTGVNYALFATGLSLVFGIMFVVNMAHGELFMVGAMLVYVLLTYLNINFALAAPIAIASVAGFGFVLNRIAVQPLKGRSPWTVLLSTIGISMILLHGTLSAIGPSAHFIDTPFTGLTHVGEITIATEGIILCGVGLAAIAAINIFLRRAKTGKDMQATIQSPVGASLCGIHIRRVYDYALILASGLAALGGVLNAVLNTYSPYMGQAMLVKGFAIVVVAGLGNLTGAIILGIIFGVAESLFSLFVDPYFRETFIYGIMVLVLLLKPEGLFARRE